MKILNVLVLICCVQLVFAQTDLVMLQAGLEQDYNLAEQSKLIKLGRELPIKVSAEKSDLTAWHEARAQTAKLYVQWYEKMFDNGYKLNENAQILGDYSKPPKNEDGEYEETEDQKERRLKNLLKTNNRKYAIATFLIAEQRLKKFTKNSYKSNKKKHFKEELLTIGESHRETVEKIVDNLLTTDSYFTLYEVKVKQQVEQTEETIMVKN